MRIAILGLGVMGGSIARAWIADERSVVGWAPSDQDRTAAAEAGVEIAEGVGHAVLDSSGVILAAPLSTFDELAAEIEAHLSPEAWIMDVASLQAPPLDIAARHGLSGRWITTHPMAGRERSGFEASDEHLYAGARVWLSAPQEVDRESRDLAVQLWKLLGGDPAWIDPAEHDRRMAWASHLPQVVATAVADALLHEGIEPEELGPGGHDVTRLAGSSPEMWTELLRRSGPEVARALRAVIERLEWDAESLAESNPGEAIERLRRTGPWRRGEGSPGPGSAR